MNSTLPEGFAAWLEGRIQDPLVAMELALCCEYEQAGLEAQADRRRELPSQVDAHDLSATGWGVICPQEQGDPMKARLRLLLARREQQAKARYRESICRSNESGRDFLQRHGVTPGTLDPERLPYYLLLVGGPEEIPFEFQYHLSINHAVGRIAFDDIDDYECYARAVVAAETKGVDRPRRATLVSVENGDHSTKILTRHLVQPFEERLPSQAPGWKVEVRRGDAARKHALSKVLGGPETPGFLLAASHGIRFPADDPRQAGLQGALLCQDWQSGKRSTEDQWFHAGDVPEGEGLQGLIAMMMACHGAGTPVFDNYPHQGPQGRKPVTEAPEEYVLTLKPFISRLPQRLLRGGALAVVGHVDRGWTLSFGWPLQGKVGEAVGSLEDGLRRLFASHRLGHALRPLSRRYCALAAQLSELLDRKRYGVRLDEKHLAMLWTALNDARNVVILGDPAVYLRGQRGGVQEARDRGRVMVPSTASVPSAASGESSRNSTSAEANAAIEGESAPSASFESAADLEILVRQLQVGGQTSLAYELTARDPRLGLVHKDFGKVVLQVNPQRFFRDFFSSIDRLPRADVDLRVDQLQTKGASLARDLLPQPLRETLWALREDVRTVQIFSDEGWIPWEMLRIQGPALGEGAFFLSENFSLTRWLRGHPPHLHLPLRNLALVATRGGDLPSVAEEVSLLAGLFPGVERVEPTYLEVKRRLAGGGFDGWHFMGHGLALGENPNQWSIRLNDHDLTPESLDEVVGGFAIDRAPLFFLNTCHSGRGARSLTGVGGWATRLLDLGAGAFVGSSWATGDEAAKELARAFYQGLQGGLALGEAMRRARLVVREAFPGDPSWLAYTVYAHPAASCHATSPTIATRVASRHPIFESQAAQSGEFPAIIATNQRRTVLWFESRKVSGFIVIIFLILSVWVLVGLRGTGASVEEGALLAEIAAQDLQDQDMGGLTTESSEPPSMQTDKSEVRVPEVRTLKPVESGKVLVGIVDERTEGWDSWSSRAAAAIIREQVVTGRATVAGADFIDQANQILLGNTASLSGDKTTQGAEFVLVALQSKNGISSGSVNIKNVRITLDAHLLEARSGRLVASDSSTHTGSGATEAEAIKLALSRCLGKLTETLQERLNS